MNRRSYQAIASAATMRRLLSNTLLSLVGVALGGCDTEPFVPGQNNDETVAYHVLIGRDMDFLKKPLGSNTALCAAAVRNTDYAPTNQFSGGWVTFNGAPIDLVYRVVKVVGPFKGPQKAENALI